MKCNNCGNEIAPGNNFCPMCGAALSAGAGQQQEIIPGEMFTIDPRYAKAPTKATTEDARAFKSSLALAGIGTAISAIALFLPFLNFSFSSFFSQSLSLMEGNLREDGLILLAILVGGLLLIAAGKKSKGIRNIVVGAIVCFVGFIDLITNITKADGSYVKISPGIGFFLLMIGGILIIASGVIRMKKR